MMINMKYCEKCKVSVPNPKQRCPLCQGMLTGGDGTDYQQAARDAAIAMRDDIRRFVTIV